MFSLAPIRYAAILERDGGPVKVLDFAKTDIWGSECIEAVAYLDDRLRGEKREPDGERLPDGAGTHPRVQTACHMALSEAMERWAVYYCRNHRGESNGGIEIDASSNGFAAFPGLFRRQARRAAFRESIERHCLMNWWEGRLNHEKLAAPRPGLSAIRLHNPFSSHAVTLVWTNSDAKRAYGFGAGERLDHAVWRSLVELSRARRIVETMSAPGSASSSLTELYHRRIRYFAGGEGVSSFERRVRRSCCEKTPDCRLVFDSAVKGPWDRYASVWRTIIEPPSHRYLDGKDFRYFFW